MIDRTIMRLNPASERYMKLRNRGILVLASEVDEDTFGEFCENIIYLGIKPFSEPIWVILDSVGGNVYDGLGLHDIIRASIKKGREVNVLGVGLVASMASVIMQAGSKRLALPQTQFLLHQIREGLVLKVEEVSEGEERVAEAVRLNRVVLNIVAERSGKNLEEILRLVRKKDYWLDAKGAKEFGLIDEITEEWPF